MTVRAITRVGPAHGGRFRAPTFAALGKGRNSRGPLTDARFSNPRAARTGGTRLRQLIRAALPMALVAGCTAAPASEPVAPSAHSLAGRWEIVFALDSQLASRDEDPLLRWRRAPDSTVVLGTLELAGDSVRLHGNMAVDFTSLLGRQMSCYQPGAREISTAWDSDVVVIGFTPGAADCGFGAKGVVAGDTVRGFWSETSFIGPTAAGRFLMRRY